MIPSFQIDHTKLEPGLYVSRVDCWGNAKATTFDVRVCKPNKEMMQPAISHTVEHLMADYLRNESPLAQSVLYFGPMGCLTGFYLILKGIWGSGQIKSEIETAFDICANAKSIPGASAFECGNFLFNDLRGAKELCVKYANILHNAKEDRLTYPK